MNMMYILHGEQYTKLQFSYWLVKYFLCFSFPCFLFVCFCLYGE